VLKCVAGSVYIHIYIYIDIYHGHQGATRRRHATAAHVQRGGAGRKSQKSACCSILQCVAGCCSVWQCVVVEAGCCRVLQGVAGCCSVLQALLQSQLQSLTAAAGRKSHQCVAASCSVLQQIALISPVCCSKLQCVAANCIVL